MTPLEWVELIEYEVRWHQRMAQGDGIIDADIGQIHNVIRAAKKALAAPPQSTDDQTHE